MSKNHPTKYYLNSGLPNSRSTDNMFKTKNKDKINFIKASKKVIPPKEIKKNDNLVPVFNKKNTKKIINVKSPIHINDKIYRKKNNYCNYNNINNINKKLIFDNSLNNYTFDINNSKPKDQNDINKIIYNKSSNNILKSRNKVNKNKIIKKDVIMNKSFDNNKNNNNNNKINITNKNLKICNTQNNKAKIKKNNNKKDFKAYTPDKINSNKIINNNLIQPINLVNNYNLNIYNNYETKSNMNIMLNELNRYNVSIIIQLEDKFSEIVVIHTNLNETVNDLINRYKSKSKYNIDNNYNFVFNNKILNKYLYSTLQNLGLYNHSVVKCYYIGYILIGGSKSQDKKEINIKFIKISDNYNNIPLYQYKNTKLIGLLKLSLLKEISNLIESKIYLLPELISHIMQILANGKIDESNAKKTIQNVLKKLKGSNIMTFSNYVDEIMDEKSMNLLFNLLSPIQLLKIKDINYRLSNYNEYMEIFNTEFERAKRESIVDFSVISLVIMEREDLDTFKQERKRCPNRVDRILYHGTSIEPISSILTGLFEKSIDSGYQHGKGVYFTDSLDYCFFYGNKEDNRNRKNKNKIPQINETFTLIACLTYYNFFGYRKVNDCFYTPRKNEINFAYADAETNTLEYSDESKFYGTEYVIWDLNQICPFMSATLKRNEYCIIWHDENFSPFAVHNNEFDEIFKNFLKERMKYIKQFAKYNIYPCETTQEALKLVERKKYNKIILISNGGRNFEGRNFADKAREIIGNDVIVLFLAYNINHLNWIKYYKNAIFSNEATFYEEYLQCFSEEDSPEIKLQSLIKKIEDHYNVEFNFDNNFLYYPNFKKNGMYSDLSFNNYY